jgi:hypothetical protein
MLGCFFIYLCYEVERSSSEGFFGDDGIVAANLVAAHALYADAIVYPGHLTAHHYGLNRASLLALAAPGALVLNHYRSRIDEIVDEKARQKTGCLAHKSAAGAGGMFEIVHFDTSDGFTQHIYVSRIGYANATPGGIVGGADICRFEPYDLRGNAIKRNRIRTG